MAFKFAHSALSAQNTPKEYDPARSRRLLITKKEIEYLTGKLHEKGLTLLPLEVYTKRGLIKLKLGLGKPLKKADKRDSIRKKEVDREIQRAVQSRLKTEYGDDRLRRDE